MSFREKVKKVIDEHGKEVVQMDIDVFEAIESYVEDQGLLELILENDPKERLEYEDALEYYSKLKKQA